jgi:anti-anti-sigma regulatory factor
MIYIKEIFHDEHSVSIQVDGVLDAEAVNLLSDVCEHHVEGQKTILLNLEGLSHISREGRNFLKEVDSRGIAINFPQFLSLKEPADDFWR